MLTNITYMITLVTIDIFGIPITDPQDVQEFAVVNVPVEIPGINNVVGMSYLSITNYYYCYNQNLL